MLVILHCDVLNSSGLNVGMCVYICISIYFYALIIDVQMGDIQVLNGLFINSTYSSFSIKLSKSL